MKRFIFILAILALFASLHVSTLAIPRSASAVSSIDVAACSNGSFIHGSSSVSESSFAGHFHHRLCDVAPKSYWSSLRNITKRDTSMISAIDSPFTIKKLDKCISYTSWVREFLDTLTSYGERYSVVSLITHLPFCPVAIADTPFAHNKFERLAHAKDAEMTAEVVVGDFNADDAAAAVEAKFYSLAHSKNWEASSVDKSEVSQDYDYAFVEHKLELLKNVAGDAIDAHAVSAAVEPKYYPLENPKNWEMLSVDDGDDSDEDAAVECTLAPLKNAEDSEAASADSSDALLYVLDKPDTSLTTKRSGSDVDKLDSLDENENTESSAASARDGVAVAYKVVHVVPVQSSKTTATFQFAAGDSSSWNVWANLFTPLFTLSNRRPAESNKLHARLLNEEPYGGESHQTSTKIIGILVGVVMGVIISAGIYAIIKRHCEAKARRKEQDRKMSLSRKQNAREIELLRINTVLRSMTRSQRRRLRSIASEGTFANISPLRINTPPRVAAPPIINVQQMWNQEDLDNAFEMNELRLHRIARSAYGTLAFGSARSPRLAYFLRRNNPAPWDELSLNGSEDSFPLVDPPANSPVKTDAEVLADRDAQRNAAVATPRPVRIAREFSFELDCPDALEVAISPPRELRLPRTARSEGYGRPA